MAELVYGHRRALVVSKVELDRPHLALMRIHLTSFPTPGRRGFCRHPLTEKLAIDAIKQAVGREGPSSGGSLASRDDQGV